MGEEYFLDHVHPTIDAHRSIAVAILTELQDLGWLKGGVIPEQELGQITDRIKSSIDRERQAIAFRNLAKVLHWAGKFEEAIPNAINATQLVPDDLESWFVMGDCLRSLVEIKSLISSMSNCFKKVTMEELICHLENS